MPTRYAKAACQLAGTAGRAGA
ncbi:MAG: hypothetical protein QOK40_615, partial [Miltoncostaeaceae bacterium]|nr:hypothetical protein [Miltoncostaeaceae bacterium]